MMLLHLFAALPFIRMSLGEKPGRLTFMLAPSPVTLLICVNHEPRERAVFVVVPSVRFAAVQLDVDLISGLQV